MPTVTLSNGSPPPSRRPVTPALTTEIMDAAPSHTPPRPPYSPVTPILNSAPLFELDTGGMQEEAPLPQRLVSSSETTYNSSGLPRPGLGATSLDLNASTPQWGPEPLLVTEPATIPLNPSENPDVLALRSAISILQMQRQQALSDLKTLSRIKEAAVADPETFSHELKAGSLRKPSSDGILNLDRPEALSTSAGQKQSRSPFHTSEDASLSPQTNQMPLNDTESHFETFPHQQNIIRMPRINWDKYQVVGDSLDRIHAEQLRRPSEGHAPNEQISGQRMADARSPQQHVAAPYRPFANGRDEAMPISGASNGSGGSKPE